VIPVGQVSFFLPPRIKIGRWTQSNEWRALYDRTAQSCIHARATTPAPTIRPPTGTAVGDSDPPPCAIFPGEILTCADRVPILVPERVAVRASGLHLLVSERLAPACDGEVPAFLLASQLWYLWQPAGD